MNKDDAAYRRGVETWLGPRLAAITSEQLEAITEAAIEIDDRARAAGKSDGGWTWPNDRQFGHAVGGITGPAKAVVTLYGLPECAQCFATQWLLAKQGIAFVEVDLSDLPGQVAAFKERGLRSAPVVTVRAADGSVQEWSGLRPDKIKALASRAQDRNPHPAPPVAVAGEGVEPAVRAGMVI